MPDRVANLLWPRHDRAASRRQARLLGVHLGVVGKRLRYADLMVPTGISLLLAGEPF